MKYGFVIRHGWGFSARDMAPLAEALELLSDRIIVDELGYLGAAPNVYPHDATQEWIAIGHSYGFAHLLEEDAAWSAIVGLGAFLRFPGDGVPAMQAAFSRNGRATLQAFHRRCDLEQPVDLDALDTGGITRLTHALEDIASLDLRMPRTPVLVLAGANDRIVPAASQREMTAHCPQAIFAQHASAGHALGIREPAWCVERIAAFMQNLRRPKREPATQF